MILTSLWRKRRIQIRSEVTVIVNEVNEADNKLILKQ
jgi:hypothetical protein